MNEGKNSVPSAEAESRSLDSSLPTSVESKEVANYGGLFHRSAGASTMSDEKNHPTFYAFGTDDRPRCPQCGRRMHLTGRAPSSLLGDAYECREFTCICGFQIEQDADREAKSMTGKTAH